MSETYINQLYHLNYNHQRYPIYNPIEAHLGDTPINYVNYSP